MSVEKSAAFGVLLRRYRVAAGLTQEELAERAALSARAIADLERGVRTQPQPRTMHHLADALGLSPQDRVLFVEAARPIGIPSRGGPHTVPVRATGHFLGAAPSGALVARANEMAHIHVILEMVSGGTGQLLLLAGELGVGKTRLAQEVMVATHTLGFVVGTGSCHQGAQAMPYYSVLEALDGLESTAPARVRAEVQRRRQELRRLWSDGPVSNGARGDRLEEQQLFFRAVGGLLVTLAVCAPVAVLLDDLHWADDGTVTLLHHLARATRGARVFLLGTVRDVHLSDEHPVLARVLQDLSRERLLERISVRPLAAEETAVLVAALMEQTQVSEELADFVHRRSKGNPRFIEQLVRSLGGRLQLRREIGAGAMGRVFEALDVKTGRTVAAKLMLSRGETDLDNLLRFQQEGAILTALSHPHIVTIYGTFVEEHASCIIMEFLDGRSLGQLLREGPLSLPRAKHLALQVVTALSYAHAQGVVHRDIKPDNVMVVGDDQVKVTDFGIARLLRPDTSLATIATTGMRLGTPLYMAPEQIEGKKVDGRTDLYALGAMLHHMVTGQPPFVGDDALAVALQHLQADPPRPSAINPAVPADWDALIGKALEKEPARRFQSAKELEQTIAALGVVARAPVHARHQTRVAAVGLSRWRSLPRWGAAAGLLLVLAVAVIVVRAHSSTASQASSLGARIDSYLSGLAARTQLSGTVLVAERGALVLSKGYGLADRARGLPNTATTRYPVGTVSTTWSAVTLLHENEFRGGRVALVSSICRYLPRCPVSWRPITVRMVLEGTSRLPDYQWGHPGLTTQQTVAACQAEPVAGYPPSTDNDCDSAVLATLVEQANPGPWENELATAIFNPAGMFNSGRMTDALAAGAPGFALDYFGATPDPSHVYNDFFAAYSTAPDIYAYDNALFRGTLLSRPDTAAVLAPRRAVIPPDPGITDPRWGDYWRVGILFGQRVVYTIGDVNDYVTVNMRFPDAGVTVIIVSNDLQNDVVSIALHTAALVFGRHLAPPPSMQTTAPAGLVGTYHRTLQEVDRRAAHDPGLADWVGLTLSVTIRTGWIDVGPSNNPTIEEYYTATTAGRLSLLGYPPGNQNGFCSVIRTEAPPTGSYRWARQGKSLIITRLGFDPCLDRGAIIPGRWTKIG